MAVVTSAVHSDAACFVNYTSNYHAFMNTDFRTWSWCSVFLLGNFSAMIEVLVQFIIDLQRLKH